MAKPAQSSSLAVVVVIVVAGFFYFSQQNGGTRASESATTVEVEQDLEVKNFTPVRVTSSQFDVLPNCHLAKHRHNDGDSFHVRHGGKDTEFRLYYVDSPESAYKTYRDGNNNGERLEQQGKYFGRLTQEQTADVGKAAKDFSLKLLSAGEFRVVTKWEGVFDSERRYAFVLVKWHGREVYLHELLVAQGLVRIYTKPNTLPDNTSASRHRQKLKELEAQARAQKLGGWGIDQ